MREKLSNKCKNEEDGRTKKYESYGSCIDAGEKQSTSDEIMESIKGENGSVQNVHSESDTSDGGWGWLIVLASFLMQFIGGYQNYEVLVNQNQENMI